MKADFISRGKTSSGPHLGCRTGRELSVVGGIRTETGLRRVRDEARGEQLGPAPPPAGCARRLQGRNTHVFGLKMNLHFSSSAARSPTGAAAKKSHLYLLSSALELEVQINFM